MVRESWLCGKGKMRKSCECGLYRIAKESWIIAIGNLEHGISPEAVDSKCETDNEDEREKFFGKCAHRFS